MQKNRLGISHTIYYRAIIFEGFLIVLEWIKI